MRISKHMTQRAARWPVIMALLLFFFLSGSPAAAEVRIGVLLSSPDQPFSQALDGFREHLRQQGVDAVYETHQLDGDAGKAEQAAQRVRAGGARLVLAIGTIAADSAVKRIADIPVIACLVMRLDILRNAPNATGVGLEFPFDVQFRWLQTILPEARTVGMIYNPGENRPRIEAAKRAASEKGLRLLPFEVKAPQDLPAALNAVSREADVLLSVPDSIAFAPQMAKPLLLFSFRNSIPLVGLSANWVKAGAIYSLDWDYADLGAQAGEMARQVLQGTPPGTIPPASPRKTLYTLNLRTAEQMKLTFSGDLVRKARTTY